MGEAFSDFMASEVLADLAPKLSLSELEYQNGFANVIRMPRACKDEGDFDSHPHLQKRIDRIFLAHPKIQTLMGCSGVTSKKLRYCGEDLSRAH